MEVIAEEAGTSWEEFSQWAGKAVVDYAYAPLASLIGVDVEEEAGAARRGTSTHVPTPRSSTHTPRSSVSSPDTTHRAAYVARDAHLKDQKTPTPKMLRELRARELLQQQHEATPRKFQECDGTCCTRVLARESPSRRTPMRAACILPRRGKDRGSGGWRTLVRVIGFHCQTETRRRRIGVAVQPATRWR